VYVHIYTPVAGCLGLLVSVFFSGTVSCSGSFVASLAVLLMFWLYFEETNAHTNVHTQARMYICNIHIYTCKLYI